MDPRLLHARRDSRQGGSEASARARLLKICVSLDLRLHVSVPCRYPQRESQRLGDSNYASESQLIMRSLADQGSWREAGCVPGMGMHRD
jgi:hypothetical protein